MFRRELIHHLFISFHFISLHKIRYQFKARLVVKAYIRSREYRSRAVSELAASDEETFTEIHLQNGKKYFPKFETSFSYLNNLKYRSYEPLVKCHFNHDLSAPQEKAPTMTVTSGIQIKKGSQHMRKAPIKKTWPTKGCKQTE